MMHSRKLVAAAVPDLGHEQQEFETHDAEEPLVAAPDVVATRFPGMRASIRPIAQVSVIPANISPAPTNPDKAI